MTTLELSATGVPSRTGRAPGANQVRRGHRLGIQGRIYGVLLLLVAVAVLATVIGAVSMSAYHTHVAALARGSERALLGEQMDKLVTAVVMDSRGIYMAADKAEAEKYAPLLLKSLALLRQRTAAWVALAPPDQRASTDDASRRVEEFIGFRTELVRLAREVGLPQARAFGDNDANRANRSQLNKVLTGLVEQDSQDTAMLARGLEDLYSARLQLLIAICLIGVLGGSALAVWVVRRGVAKPLSGMVKAVSAVAAGNLQTAVPGLDSGGEIGALGRALSTFRDSLLAQQASGREREEMRLRTEQEGRQELLKMCESLESDLEVAVAEVLQHSRDSVLSGERVASDGQAIASEALTVASSAEQASGNVTSVSAATEELSAAGREIARRAAQSCEYTTKAVTEVEQAGATIVALNAAAEQIRAVVSLISAVASQTNLLALNATIEAARAGEAGRGFSVVATEVKALARKTAEAAEDINARIEQICTASGQGVDVLTRIGASVREINEVNAGVAAAADQQEATLQEIARSLGEAASGVSAVAVGVGSISRKAEQVQSQSRAAAAIVAQTDKRVSELRTNLIASLRLSIAGDRRSAELRTPVQMSGRLHVAGRDHNGSILDISPGGARFRTAGSDCAAAAGASATLAIGSIGEIRGAVISTSPAGVHLQFDDLSSDVRQRLDAAISAVEQADAVFIDAAKDVSRKVAQAFQTALTRGEISAEDLFDVNYAPIAGSDPAQFTTRALALCDRVLPPIQEPVLRLDPRIAFCAAVDRNGFLPTHNLQFSNPPRTGDPVWNAANCRNRRMFNDRTGLAAARNTRELLMQTYDRDMGDGTVVTLKEVDVPIRIDGRHWGAIRLAFRR